MKWSLEKNGGNMSENLRLLTVTVLFLTTCALLMVVGIAQLSLDTTIQLIYRQLTIMDSSYVSRKEFMRHKHEYSTGMPFKKGGIEYEYKR